MAENKNEFETIDFENLPQEKNENKNIFSDFNADTSLEEDLKKEKNKINKDIFYYLWIASKYLSFVFIILIIVLVIWYSYFFTQKYSNFSDNQFLAPVCSVLNGDISNLWNWCNSLNYNKDFLEKELDSLYGEQINDILKIIYLVYEKENFLKTKELSFLLDKSENKLKVLDILEKFDYFKNEFTWIEKKLLRCYNLSIDSSDKTLIMKCDAFSSSYAQDNIIWFSWDREWDKLSWTAISVANSFINFLEKNASKYFIVIDRQKIFDLQNYDWSDWFTKKTTFDLKLKINF